MSSEHDDDRKKVVHAAICAPGAEMLRAFCMSHGVTTTAFLDGLSHALGGFVDVSLSDLKQQTPVLAAALTAARQIDARRRSREPAPPPQQTLAAYVDY